MTDPAKLYSQAVTALNQRQWSQASGLCVQILPRVPNHAGVHFVAGVAALEQQLIPAALKHLHRATTLNPGRADYAAQLARALAAANMPAESIIAADHSMRLEPADSMSLEALGVAYWSANSYRKSAEAFARAAKLAPERANVRFNLATSLMAAGELERAEAELEACLASDPSYWKAWLSLAQIRKQTEADGLAARLDQRLQQAADSADATMYLQLALAKVHEDLGDFERAFDHLSRGKAAGSAGRDSSTVRDRALFDALIEETARLPETSGCDSREPIFLVGMPRSGTTLVDRILSSHPELYSAGELHNFSVALKRASGSRTPALLDRDTITRATQCDLARTGREYLESTRPATADKAHFTDKLPHNFLYAGFLASAFPNAKIICLRRNPMDTCLSNFRQLFAQGNPFYDYSFNLLDTGRYYLQFDRLMNHWDQLFPGRILSVQYETLVDDQERSTREMLAFCGLPFDEACLRFEDNAAPVATASAVQVREPMFRSSLDRWKRYGSALDELADLLRDGGVAIE